MKKIGLLATAALTAFSFAAPALAADIAPAYKAAPMAPIAVYNWTGFYIGGHIGGGWADQNSVELAPGTGAYPTGTAFTGKNLSGFLGGVQGGYNWQLSNIVLGIEGEYTWADVSGSATTVSTVPRFLGFSSISTAKLQDIALVTGRLGYAANNWLFYFKGGGAWGQGKSFSVNNNANGTLFDTSSSSTDRSGWVVGVGAEWGFAPNWSAKIEYNYIDFGSSNVTLNSSLGTQNFVSSSEKVNIVKAGVNYRFNWGGPAVAHY
ncbi:MAG: outer membrane beta-barrel protein [Bradyrhizobium sp.]